MSLICKAYGVPPARVRWNREDGRPLMDGKINSTSSSSSSLAVDNSLNANNKRGTGQLELKEEKNMHNFNPNLNVEVDKAEMGRISVAQDGEELIFTKISRTDSAAYLCIASNGIPPSVSKRIILDVECKRARLVPNCERSEREKEST